MMALLLALLLGLSAPGPCVPVLGEAGSSDVARAERAYRAGRFAEAFTLYHAALSEPGLPHGALLYNLGNCAYRQGRHAEAVLYYRRALLRQPGDPHAAFNLQLTEQQLGVRSAGTSFGAEVAVWVDSFSPGGLLVLVGGLQGLGLLGVCLLRRRRAARRAMALIVLLAFLGGLRLVYSQWFVGMSGVVVAREVGLRREPHQDLGITLRLTAGELVRVAEMSDRWVRVEHARGSGWVERAAVGLVE